MFIDRAPCTKLHKREQKDRTKILAEIPKHGLKDHGADKINIQFIKDSLEVILDSCYGYYQLFLDDVNISFNVEDAEVVPAIQARIS